MRRITLALIMLFVATSAFARGGLPGHNPYATQAPGCPPGVIDGLVLKPTIAVSLSRKLRTAYAGFAFQVERTSDTHTADIGFDKFCNTDTTALLAFCAATNCNVNIWYDQSGNVHNEVPQGNGPRIVTAGSLTVSIGSNTRIAANTNGSFMQEAVAVNGAVGTTAGAIYAVANAASAGVSSTTASWWNCDSAVMVSFSDSNGKTAGICFYQTGTPLSPPSVVPFRYLGTWLGAHTDMPTVLSYTFGTAAIFALRWSTSDAAPTKGYLNGGAPATNGNSSANNAADAQVNLFGSSIGLFSGSMAEAFTFAAQPSLTDANYLGHNEANYYGLTWTTITQ